MFYPLTYGRYKTKYKKYEVFYKDIITKLFYFKMISVSVSSQLKLCEQKQNAQLS